MAVTKLLSFLLHYGFQQMITCRTVCNGWLRLDFEYQRRLHSVRKSWDSAFFRERRPNRVDSKTLSLALSTKDVSKPYLILRHLNNVRSSQRCPTVATAYRCPLPTMRQYPSNVQACGSAGNTKVLQLNRCETIRDFQTHLTDTFTP